MNKLHIITDVTNMRLVYLNNLFLLTVILKFNLKKIKVERKGMLIDNMIWLVVYSPTHVFPIVWSSHMLIRSRIALYFKWTTKPSFLCSTTSHREMRRPVDGWNEGRNSGKRQDEAVHSRWAFLFVSTRQLWTGNNKFSGSEHHDRVLLTKYLAKVAIQSYCAQLCYIFKDKMLTLLSQQFFN